MPGGEASQIGRTHTQKAERRRACVYAEADEGVEGSTATDTPK